MGYLFAIGVALLWTIAFYKVSPNVLYFTLPITGFIIFLWIQSHIAEERDKVERERRYRKELDDLAAKFFSLNVKFLSDGESAIQGFQSEIDAELAALRMGGCYFEHQNTYVVANRNITDAEIKTCKAFLARSLTSRTPSPEDTFPIFTLASVPESKKAQELRRERVAKLQADRDKIRAALLSNIEARNRFDFLTGATAVYVFSSKVACKVGISDDPDKRLRQIQTGHPSQLRIAKVWWFATADDAARVEKQTHAQLKVRGAHASGEWFSAMPNVVIECVRKVISDLLKTSEIDRSLRKLGASPLCDDDLILGKLALLQWQVSRKGNEWIELDSHHVVVFKSHGQYGYSHNQRFSKETFRTKADAKAAALLAIHQALKPPSP